MNTNYSKIALLLALGVIAGDKVGAEDLSKLRIRSTEKEEQSALARSASKAKLAIEKFTNQFQIQMDALALRNNLDYKTDKETKTIGYSDILSSDALKPIKSFLEDSEKGDVELVAFVKSLKKLGRETLDDIKTISANSVALSATQALKDVGSRTDAEKALTLSSSEEIAGLFKNTVLDGLSDTKLNNLKHFSPKCIEALSVSSELQNQIAAAVSGMKNTKIKVTETGSSNLGEVDYKPVLDKISVFFKVVSAELGAKINNLSAISATEAKKIINASNKVNAAKRFFKGMNFVSDAGFIKAMTAVLNDGFEAKLRSARAKFDTLSKAQSTSIADKKKAITEMLVPFGQNMAVSSSTDSDVFKFLDQTARIASGNGGEVIDAERRYAFGTDDSAECDDKKDQDPQYVLGKKLSAKLNALQKSLAKTSDSKMKSSTMVSSYSDIEKGLTTSLAYTPDIEWTSSNTRKGDALNLLRKNLDNAKNAKKDNKLSNAEENNSWIEKVKRYYDFFTSQANAQMATLMSDSDLVAQEGFLKNSNKKDLESFLADAKRIYDEFIAEFSVIPTAPTPVGTAAAPAEGTAAAPAAPAAGTPDVNQEGTGDVKRLTDFLAQGQGKGVRKIEEKEEVNLDDIDLTALLNSQTGKLLNGDDAKEALEILNKFLADTVKSLKGDSKKPVSLKTKKDRAISIINELVDKFTEAYDGEDPEGGEDEKKQKALTAAKNKAVAAAKDEITTKVYKAFGIKVQKPSGIKAGQGSKKRMGGTNTRGRNRTRGNSRRRVQKNDTGQKGRKVENDTGQKGRKGKRGIVVRRGRTKASNKSEE